VGPAIFTLRWEIIEVVGAMRGQLNPGERWSSKYFLGTFQGMWGL
jgi:hypothetical protein